LKICNIIRSSFQNGWLVRTCNICTVFSLDCTASYCRLIYDELERIWKEAIVAYSTWYPIIRLEKLRQTTKNHGNNCRGFDPVWFQTDTAGLTRSVVAQLTFSVPVYVVEVMNMVTMLNMDVRFINFFFTVSTATVGLASAFQFHDHFTAGRTPWVSDQLVARPLLKYRKTQTQNKHIHTPNIRALCRIRTHDRSFRANEDSSCLSPLDYCGRHIKI
jgi:hypothetical protein